MDTNMKKILNIVICTAAVLAMTSCEKFFTREPINKFSAETYFASEAEMKMYTDGMLNSWLPDYSETASADAYNDLIGTKTSSDFFRADVEWDSSKQGTTWSWTFARRCNYMIEMMERTAKAKWPMTFTTTISVWHVSGGLTPTSQESRHGATFPGFPSISSPPIPFSTQTVMTANS